MHSVKAVSHAARGRSRLACLLANALAASICCAADSAPAMFLKKLTAVAGSGSRDCGAIPLAGDQAGAIACARAAATAGEAYRVAVQLHGTDSLAWQGAARDRAGKLWVVFYDDANPSGGSPASVTLSVLACREITFATNVEDTIDCQPFIGEP